MADRPKSGTTPAYGVAWVIGLTIVAAALMRLRSGVDAVFLGECLFYGLLLAWLARRPEVRRRLRGDDAGYGRIIVAFVALLIVGQLVADGRRTYPFVPWAMYSTPARKAPIFLECHGVLADGEEVVIPAARMFKSLSVRIVRTWLKLAEAAVAETDPEAKAESWRKFDGLVESMALEYNRKNPGPPVVEAIVWQIMIPANARSDTDAYPREVFRRVTVSGGAMR
ncbi:MAG: hypothetical protein GY885_05335 [Phycisphaeraceae bacterium]|nr:hypothetical protein [Phycisphaeraceae bacterium]